MTEQEYTQRITEVQAECNRLLEKVREYRDVSIRLAHADKQNARANLWLMMETHRQWADAAFGPDYSIAKTIRHAEKELTEILANPMDRMEWIDLMRLAMDGYRRSGGNDIVADWWRKQLICENRKWSSPIDGQPAEHIRDDDFQDANMLEILKGDAS